jgi:hypothetical protein
MIADMLPPSTVVELHLDGVHVGMIVVERSHDSWTFGHFTPNDNFSAFAPRFGWWSLLMHEDGGQALDRRTALELRQAEKALDSMRAELYDAAKGTWHAIRQINLDGQMAEWNEA